MTWPTSPRTAPEAAVPGIRVLEWLVRATQAQTPHRLLTRHFLRQFLENDLVSPESDRSQTLATVSATLISLTLFVSVVMSAKYLGPLMTPGVVAVLALDDRFFYLALGMIVTALVAASQWDALAIDSRDAAILEPLPVPTATVRRAKLSAVAILGGGAAVAVNVCASVVFPLLLVFGFRQMSVLGLVALVAAHAVFTIVAAGFGYLAIVTVREAAVALLGVRLFTRASPWMQGALIVVLGGALLVLPPATSRIAQRGFDDWRANTPPMWFLGAYEWTAGGVIANQPPRWMPPRIAERERLAGTLYQERQRRFAGLAARAGLAVAVTLLVAAAAYLWNARRVQSLALVPVAGARRKWRFPRALVNRVFIGRAAARAGFHFALAAMWRSRSHRLTLASAIAVGFAMAILAISSTDAPGEMTPRVLAVQPLLYGALLVGFRHAIRVPAELRANWGFQLAWREDRRAFVGGVKAAAMFALALPAILLVLPLFGFVMGLERALMHGVLGLAGALVLLEALMLGYEKVPFACTYVPAENIKAFAPIYAIAFVVGAVMFARLQYWALGGHWIAVLTALAIAIVVLRLIALTRTLARSVQFDEVPVTLQRLGLDG